MRDKKTIAADVKKKLKISDSDFQSYEKIEKTNEIWNSIIYDLTLTNKQVELAEELSKELIDFSDENCLNLFCIYNPKEGKMEKLNIQPLPKTREGAFQFVSLLDNILRDGKEIVSYNNLAHGQKKVETYVRSQSGALGVTSTEVASIIAEPKKPKAVRKPGGFKMWTNKVFGWFKSDVEPYTNYQRDLAQYNKDVEEYKLHVHAAKKFEHDSIPSIQKQTQEYKAYKEINQEIVKNKTAEEKLEELGLWEKEREQTVELAAGRTNELIGRHENYVALTQIPLNKSEILPMEGLALLVSCSSEINESVRDNSTQMRQDFLPKEGKTFTEEEKAIINKVKEQAARTNAGGKILETFYGGRDIERMGNRGTAVVEARKKLNEAEVSYRAGNKEPLARLIKDSLPVLLEYLRDTTIGLLTSSGKAVIDIGKAVDKLFKDDPELKTMVGVNEEDLQMVVGASKLIERVTQPNQRRFESMNKNFSAGQNDKEAFLREMLYDEFLYNILTEEIDKMDKDASEIADVELTGNIQQLADKIDDHKREIVSGYYMLRKVELKKNPDMYMKFGSKDFDEKVLKEVFEKKFVNTPEFEMLLTLDKDLLLSTRPSELLNGIVKGQAEKKEAIMEARKMKEKQKNAPKEKRELSAEEIKQAEAAKEKQEELEQDTEDQLRRNNLIHEDNLKDEQLVRLGLKERKIEPLEITQVLDPKEVYVNQQVRLGKMLHSEYNGTIKNLRRALGKMIAAKQVEVYIREKGDKLTDDQKYALCSYENIEERAKLIENSTAMGLLVDENNKFLEPGNLCKLAIGAEDILDPSKEPGKLPTKTSESVIENLTAKMTAATKNELPPVDDVLRRIPQEVKKEAAPVMH